MRFGYALSSEEVRPADLVRNAARAEQAGFEFALISDHYHPWIDRQGQSSFVWTVLGGIAEATQNLTVGTGVTCPMMRIHPAIIAQAAATAADMFRGRFFLGVGTGENLNEHILGERWPSADERRDMLEEAVALIRMLWVGKEISFDGAYYGVRDARIYTLPEKLPPIYVAASGPMAAELASRIGDGLISTAPDPKVIEAFGTNGGQPKPRIGQVSVVWHADEAQARHIAHEYWPTAAMHGEISQELPLPRHFEQAVQDVTEDQVAKTVVCGSEVERHVEAIEKFVEAGFDEVYVHQIGPEQEEFFRAYEREVLPELRRALAAA